MATVVRNHTTILCLLKSNYISNRLKTKLLFSNFMVIFCEEKQCSDALAESTCFPNNVPLVSYILIKTKRKENHTRGINITVQRAVSWLRQLVACLSPRRPGFAPESLYVGFVVDKMSL
jgi:hypothetical protein